MVSVLPVPWLVDLPSVKVWLVPSVIEPLRLRKGLAARFTRATIRPYTDDNAVYRDRSSETLETSRALRRATT